VVYCVHGAIWLCTRATDQLKDRAIALTKNLWLLESALAVIFLLMTFFYTRLWHNVFAKPYLLALPLLAVLGLFGQRLFLAKGGYWKAWFSSSVLILGVTLFGVAGLFPSLMPSSIDPAYSVTAFNAASSQSCSAWSSASCPSLSDTNPGSISNSGTRSRLRAWTGDSPTD